MLKTSDEDSNVAGSERQVIAMQYTWDAFCECILKNIYPVPGRIPGRHIDDEFRGMIEDGHRGLYWRSKMMNSGERHMGEVNWELCKRNIR